MAKAKADMCNFHEIPEGKIRLLGGMMAIVSWDERSNEGDIIYPEPEFLSFTHQHTRDDAADKARMLAPHIERWIHTI